MTTPQDPDGPRPQVPPTEPEQPTARLEHPAVGQEPAAEPAQPTVEHPSAEQPEHPAAGPGAEQHTSAFATPAPAVPRSRWRGAGATAGRVARHRATLLVAALLIGGVIGAGTMALVQHGDRDSRPAVSDSRDRVGPGGPRGRTEHRHGDDHDRGDRNRGGDRQGPGHG
ncbi:hypothetical protein [Actinokineospora diospyrosa]|uniref:Uncharacterized protein n=1 Tax=Actinokineospora diospyrosa TaxID=103728 RepID=A0ABT1I5Z5_9PSEU|nr:hypothetical protein [Actinokineospora diospyrosa]MCP2268031.1 hypothetical protein [Actinokineospora diospyrosa]